MGEMLVFAFFGVMFWIIVVPISAGQPSMTRSGVQWLPFALMALLLVTLLVLGLQSRLLGPVLPITRH